MPPGLRSRRHVGSEVVIEGEKLLWSVRTSGIDLLRMAKRLERVEAQNLIEASGNVLPKGRLIEITRQ